MMRKRHVLLMNSILLTIYFLGSMPYYLTQGATLDRFIIAAIFFTILVLAHEFFIILALIFQWIGYFSHTRSWIRLANWAILIGIIVGILLIFPIFILIPLILMNSLSKESKLIKKNSVFDSK